MSHIIRLLEPELINRIAAGEVIERPSSVVKELLENALDANATEIHISIRNAGQTLIKIQDNGYGMTAEALTMAVQRHTTSKLPDGDLWNIHTFGFRGEALASITSIARAILTSKTDDSTHGWSLSIEGGKHRSLKPASCERGTCIEIRDLFFATPARLKFLRSPSQEYIYLHRLIERFLLLYPEVTFFIQLDEKQKIFQKATLNQRITQLFKLALSDGFLIDTTKKSLSVRGWCSLPGIHRRNTEHIFFYANNRSIDDKMLMHSVKFAYHDLIPKDRFPCVVLFLKLPYEDLDVNVHPAKTQVRFKDSQEIREIVMTALRSGLFEHSRKTVPQHIPAQKIQSSPRISTQSPYIFTSPPEVPKVLLSSLKESAHSLKQNTLFARPSINLGQAIGQIHHRYILAINDEGLVIVDPHGAHERILYERMKHQWQSFDVQFLIPALPLELTEAEKLRVEMHFDALAEAGFPIEKDNNTFYLKGIPTVLHEHSAKEIWDSLLSSLNEDVEHPPKEIVSRIVHHVLAYWACRKSIFLGDKLSLEEINALLRAMENSPHSAQCNHGRKVYRVFPLHQIATWFDRT